MGHNKVPFSIIGGNLTGDIFYDIFLHMNLKKCLNTNVVKVGLKGTTKNEIIEEMVDIIVANGRNLDKDELLKVILEREAQMSTGMKNGIAIPHGKTDTVSDMYAAIGLSSNPVEFESLDDNPSQIFVMTISPASQTGSHLQFLAAVSNLLGKESLRKKMLEAESDEKLLSLFLQGE